MPSRAPGWDAVPVDPGALSSPQLLSRLGVLVAILWGLGVVALSTASERPLVLIGLLGTAPLLAAALSRVSHTLYVSVGTVIVAGVLADHDPSGTSEVHGFLVGALVMIGGLAVGVAWFRTRMQHAISQVVEVAEVAQQALLRPLPESVSGVPMAVRYLSAHHAALIGGDLYEAEDTEFGLRIVVGDVRGKGLDAVRLAAVVMGSFREAAHREPRLADVADALNRSVRRERGPEDFVTVLLAEVRSGAAVTFVRCGHPNPVVIDALGARELDLPGSLPLGFPGAAREERRVLGSGATVLLYTDGASEARREDVFFPLVEQALHAFTGRGVGEGLSAIEAELHRWVRGDLNDDVAMLAFQLPAAPASPATPAEEPTAAA